MAGVDLVVGLLLPVVREPVEAKGEDLRQRLEAGRPVVRGARVADLARDRVGPVHCLKAHHGHQAVQDRVAVLDLSARPHQSSARRLMWMMLP